MELTNCPNPSCGASLPGRGNICPKCRTQFKCANKECSELLVLGEDICLYCGQEVLQLQKKGNAQMNKIKYSKSVDGKKTDEKFEALFTDATGGNVGTAFGHFLGTRVVIKNGNGKAIGNPQVDVQDPTQDTEYQEEVPEPPKALPLRSENSELDKLLEIFRADGESVSLKDPELKAKNKKDFFIRLTCLLLYMRSLQGVEKVQKTQLVDLMNKASVYDANYRHWLRDEQNLLHVSGDEVELRLPGIQLAKRVLEEKSDPTIEGWVVGTVKSSGRKKPKAKGKKEGGDDN